MSKQIEYIADAQFVMIEDREPRNKRSLAPVFTAGLIVGIVFLFSLGMKVGREADSMPRTEQEVWSQKMQPKEARSIATHQAPHQLSRRERALLILNQMEALWSKQ